MSKEEIQKALNEGHIVECKATWRTDDDGAFWFPSCVNDEKNAQEADLTNYEYRIKP